jgi:hypothetical protein
MKKRTKVGLGTFGVIVVIGAISSALGGHDNSANTTSAASSAASAAAAPASAPTPSAPDSSAPSFSPDPAPTTQAPDTVTYKVWGTAGADVMYGPAGSNYSGSVPMDTSATIPANPPQYYAIQAQLQGGGSVSCSISVDGKVISQGSASGGYNIASCEISQDLFNGGWQDTNSG